MGHNCGIYVGVNEDAINKIIKHIQKKRPSLFNYATLGIIQNQNLWCSPIEYDPIVVQKSNPLFTQEQPIAIPGTYGNYGMNFSLQIPEIAIDFSPGNKFTLPPELSVLGQQKFAIKAKVCAGLGCPKEGHVNPWDIVQQMENEYSARKPSDASKSSKMQILPVGKMCCFCLSVFAVLHFSYTANNGNQYLGVELDNLEISEEDIKPDGLECALECLAKVVIKYSLLPKLKFMLQDISFGVLGMLNVTISPTPTSSVVPYNPSVANNTLGVYLNVGV